MLKMPSPIRLVTLEHLGAAHPNWVPELEQVKSKRKRPQILYSRHHLARSLMSRTPWREMTAASVNYHPPVKIAANHLQIESPSVSNRHAY